MDEHKRTLYRFYLYSIINTMNPLTIFNLQFVFCMCNFVTQRTMKLDAMLDSHLAAQTINPWMVCLTD